MRSVTLFVAGIAVGLAAQIAIAQSGNRGVAMMNHVGVNVPNIPEAVTYYTQKMGYKEAFRATNDNGEPTLVYLHISRDTFLELQQATEQAPAGQLTHWGLETPDIKATVAAFRQKGLMVSDPGAPSAFTGGILANVTDPVYGRIELSEQPAGGKLRAATEAWKE